MSEIQPLRNFEALSEPIQSVDGWGNGEDVPLVVPATKAWSDRTWRVLAPVLEATTRGCPELGAAVEVNERSLEASSFTSMTSLPVLFQESVSVDAPRDAPAAMMTCCAPSPHVPACGVTVAANVKATVPAGSGFVMLTPSDALVTG